MCKFSCVHRLSLLLGKFLDVTARQFSKSLVPCSIPTWKCVVVTLGSVSLFNFSHAGSSEVLSHCGFHCILLLNCKSHISIWDIYAYMHTLALWIGSSHSLDWSFVFLSYVSLFTYVVWDIISCNLGCCGTPYVSPGWLWTCDSPASTSWVLRL